MFGNWTKRFSPFLYLVAGGWGLLLNWFVTMFCYTNLGWSPVRSYGSGIVLNTLFNLWFTKAVLDERSRLHTRRELSYASYFLISGFLFCIGAALIWLLTDILRWSIFAAFWISASCVSFLSLFVGRIWVFISPDTASLEYQELDDVFYEDSAEPEKVGSLRAWYHGGRFKETRRIVAEYFREGMRVCDLGSGGSEWNEDRIPVTGVDIHRGMLEHGQKRGHLQDFQVRPITATELPGEIADVVVLTEVLEHMEAPLDVLCEVKRILKGEGRVILSVPWDHALSPFLWMFNANCLYRGYLLGEEYYRQRCGHVHHFTRRRLRRLLMQGGFEPERMWLFRRLLIYCVCRKRSGIGKPE
jgi:2-polyprenyl-3-methyl-5-hydroxy-6-metoxy-1,4-benzoquinol methylase